MLLIGKDKAVTRKNLNLIPVPKRPDTKHWQGIQHGQLATAIVTEAKSRSLDIASETWCINKDRQRLLGVLDFAPNKDLFPELPSSLPGASFSLGVRHSNMGQYAVAFCVGAKVFCCTNGAFAGDFVLKRRHTKDLDLAGLITDGFDQYLSRVQEMVDMMVSYAGVEIDDRDAAYAILELGADSALKNRYADDVWQQWLKPAHEEFAPRTLWSLYNAMTEVAKGMTPDIQLRLLSRGKPILENIFLN